MDSADEIVVLLIAKPILLAVAVSGIASSLISFGRPWAAFFERWFSNTKLYAFRSLPIITLGFVCGYLTGASREAAIGNLIASALTLLGGVSLLIFQDKASHFSDWAGFTVFCFACSIFYGVENGAFDREFRQTERFNKLAEQEYRIGIFRRNLQLPNEPPSWITGIPEKK